MDKKHAYFSIQIGLQDPFVVITIQIRHDREDVIITLNHNSRYHCFNICILFIAMAPWRQCNGSLFPGIHLSVYINK